MQTTLFKVNFRHERAKKDLAAEGPWLDFKESWGGKHELSLSLLN